MMESICIIQCLYRGSSLSSTYRLYPSIDTQKYRVFGFIGHPKGMWKWMRKKFKTYLNFFLILPHIYTTCLENADRANNSKNVYNDWGKMSDKREISFNAL